MKIDVKRVARREDYTIGKLSIDGKYFCDTLEDKDRGLDSLMTTAEIRSLKVHGKTAIPAGTYTVVLTMSNRFKVVLPELLNVPGYSGVRIHSGNTSADTEGCLLLGENKVIGKVLNSRVTVTKFIEKVKAAAGKGENITITIG